MIDTHSHLDGEEFAEDLEKVLERAKNAGVGRIFVPAIDLKSTKASMALAERFPGVIYPMIGLHPEEVRGGWREVLAEMKSFLEFSNSRILEISNPRKSENSNTKPAPFIAIGEVGLDFYWSREFEKEQIEAFEEQVRWSIEYRLPLMIHCRTAQNEMLHILKRYKTDLKGGVFHCFTGNEIEAKQLLEYDNFALGIGGVLTFKKSKLPETLRNAVPLDRIVIETDAPYMAPVPHRGERNESAFTVHVRAKLAEIYNVSEEEVDRITTETATKIFLT